MASRPKGYGMTAELQRKKDAKYDDELDQQARDWIEAVIGEQVFARTALSATDFHEIMKDGVILCRVNRQLAIFVVFQQIVVISGIHAFARKAHALGKTPHALGPKEATANKREFTEEQLKEGQNIIGLQMGTNKLASQAGDHFGRPRQVAGANVYK